MNDPSESPELRAAREKAIANYRAAAAKSAEAIKKKIESEIPLDVQEAVWLEMATSKFPGARSPLQMCEALINRQALSLITKRLKS